MCKKMKTSPTTAGVASPQGRKRVTSESDAATEVPLRGWVEVR